MAFLLLHNYMDFIMLNVKKVSNKIEDEKNDSIALQEFIGGN